MNFGHIDNKNGLSHNHVYGFAKDNNGFLWIGTRGGLNRYDGYGFKVFKHNPEDSTSIPSNVVQNIVKDQLGRFWIQIPTYLILFNPNNEEFVNNFTINANNRAYQNFVMDMIEPYGDSLVFIRIPGEGIIRHNIYTNSNKMLLIQDGSKNTLESLNISHFTQHKHHLYITYENGLIDVFDANSLTRKKQINLISNRLKISGKVFMSFVDKDSNIWMYCTDEALGLFMVDTSGKLFHFTNKSVPALNSNNISCVIQAPDSRLWFGSDHGGINIFNPSEWSIEYVTNDPFNESSLRQNVITSLYLSSDSIIWIGTFKQGANFFHENIYRFWHYVNFPNNPLSLPYNDVNCFAEDLNGNIWIGTNGYGLIYYNRTDNSFKTIKARPGVPAALQSDVIVSLFVDKNNHLWVGSYHGGLSVFDGKTFTNYLHNPSDNKTISSNKVWDIFEDSQGRLWIGTLGGGLDRFDRDKKVFYHYSRGGINAMNSNFVMDITEDKNGNLWFGTDQGVFVLDNNSSRFLLFYKMTNEKLSLSDNFVYNVFLDSKGRIWAGTRYGLNLFLPERNNFMPLKTDNNGGDNSIMSILEAEDGNLWLATSSGLIKMVVVSDGVGIYNEHYTIHFNEFDGLQGKEFNEGSALKTSRGELIFGGPNGFNLFFPEKTTYRSHLTSLQITGLRLFGNEVAVNKPINNRVIVRSASLNGTTIRLKSNENMFSLSFGVIDYLTPQKVHYRYKLEGFNNQWIYTTWQDRRATFTNLGSGTYRFIVQSSDFSTDWEDSEAIVSITILPAWYLSWYAYVVYIILGLTLLAIIRNYVVIKVRNRYLKKQAIEETLRQQELNRLKTQFFTNVSHEFRTPLTLILTPLDSLLKKELDSGTRKHLQLIRQNAGRLLNLVNQLLDFKKAEENKLKPDLTYGNIINHIRTTVNSFNELAEPKQINLEFVSYESELFMQFDKDKIEKIINNLLSNAFKFTQQGGSIHVVTQLIKEDSREQLSIKVKDAGIGIEKEHRDKLFERFYQVNQSLDNVTTGSGIGLSLTKEFVELHGGSISVESEPGQGSCFTVILPVIRERLGLPVDEPSEEDEMEEGFIESLLDKSKSTVLLVEDNVEFRSYLQESLLEKYNILEAENGQEALDLLEYHNPDLIVSDIMMPVMDGLQLCQKLKTNPEYSHIPIILLTAKSTHEDKVAGLTIGADEYITKPFDLDILDARISYLISMRQKFIKDYQRSLKIEPNSATITSLDEKLLNKILDLINLNLSNPDFSVNMLSKELKISRVHLYKKTMALTGKTPIELIRLVRLKRAAELLLMDELTVSEISYEVGFGDPRYFSKLFRNEYNVLPSKYKEQKMQEGE